VRLRGHALVGALLGIWVIRRAWQTKQTIDILRGVAAKLLRKRGIDGFVLRPVMFAFDRYWLAQHPHRLDAIAGTPDRRGRLTALTELAGLPLAPRAQVGTAGRRVDVDAVAKHS